MDICNEASERSTCKRLNVGSLLTDEKMNQIYSFGYNGNYAGGPNECDSDEPGNCGCVHSEVNCLIKVRPDKATVMFITDSPCKACAKLIVNAGIKKIYYHREYRNPDGLNLLKSAGVLVQQL